MRPLNAPRSGWALRRLCTIHLAQAAIEPATICCRGEGPNFLLLIPIRAGGALMIPILLLMTLFLVILGLFVWSVFTFSEQLGRIEARVAESGTDCPPPSGLARGHLGTRINLFPKRRWAGDGAESDGCIATISLAAGIWLMLCTSLKSMRKNWL